MSPQATRNSGKDERGRFLPGNKLGLRGGNQFAKRTLKLKALLYKSVTSDKWEQVVNGMVKAAASGDAAAAKLLFRYLLGEPKDDMDMRSSALSPLAAFDSLPIERRLQIIEAMKFRVNRELAEQPNGKLLTNGNR